MRRRMLSTRKLLFCVFSLLLASSCGLEERRNKARANSVRGFISGTVGYFNSEASVICAEVAEAKTEAEGVNKFETTRSIV